MTWKEELTIHFQHFDGPLQHSRYRTELERLNQYIYDEIIEKLIEDIPEYLIGMNTEDAVQTDDLKQQLRNKWL